MIGSGPRLNLHLLTFSFQLYLVMFLISMQIAKFINRSKYQYNWHIN